LETVAKYGRKVLPHTPNHPDMASSDNHLFRALEDHYRRQAIGEQ
jgi:hypothetical protein